MKWTHLRPIQVDSIKVIRSTEKHLLISATTAAGKTEAAFLPMLSDYLDEKTSGIHTLYVGPLKALINDQFRHLEQLCERSEIPVHRWHGDVTPSAKKKLVDKPSGILLITPESIESLFINRSGQLPKLFKNLRFVVIDELHGFIGNERGMHLRSLLARISSICRVDTRYAGLSATIGDLYIAKHWMCPDAPESVASVTTRSDGKEIRYQIKSFIKPASAVDLGSSGYESDLANEIVDKFANKTALIFTNSRSSAELYTDQTKRIAKGKGLKSQFEIHHGSLSKETREFTENALRSDRPTIAFCTTTLEMGIDLGNIKEVGQIGTPWSVCSLAQRLGRSGRKDGEPSVMRLYLIEREETQDKLVARLRPQLLQAIAMTELFLQKWCEPPLAGQLHLDALVQQTLSIIRERGGASATDLHSTLAKNGPFRSVNMKVYVQVLRSMGTAQLIEQTAAGLLVLGEQGERIVDSYEFYAVFETPEEFKVLHGSTIIGSIYVDVDAQPGNHIILAGRRWEIVDVEKKSKHISVRPSPAGMPPMFEPSELGDIHSRIHEAMRKVLRDESIPVYIDQNCKRLLKEARYAAKAAEIQEDNVIQVGTGIVLFTWAGNRVTRTLSHLLRTQFAHSCADDGFCIEIQNTKRNRLLEHLRELREMCMTADDFCTILPAIDSGKYMPYLSDELRRLNAFYKYYDLNGTFRFLDSLLNKNS
ncbi:MAG: DEAD/DEAH box helicase [Candidatus Hydrogenedentes bacterium]|nr:DEAD/DEAH box helicase [Candidatus Hydrogenedentota bacterium]